MLGTKGRKKKQNLKEVLRSKGIEACKKRKQHSLVLKSSGITGQAEKITSLESLRLWLGSFQHILR